MTKEEILRLQAGPELDRLVAERVMGWYLPADSEMPRAWLRPRAADPDVPWDSGEEWTGWWAEEPPLEVDEDTGEKVIPSVWLIAGSKVWSPSTDIAAAMEVLNKLLELGIICDMGQVEVYPTIDGGHGVIWYVRFRRVMMPPFVTWMSEAESLPLAICRAALLAVERGDGASANK